MHLRKLNAVPVPDAICKSVIKASFRPDRAEEALSDAEEVVVAPSMEVSDGFWFRMARAAWEPREDDARSVGVPSARRFWRASASSATVGSSKNRDDW
ncbi:hypothetical protein Taro_046085 [Colocasia esculenta]|uniref:Uncharacterized protein n=1 Tax=Colocasia esculenta TaxID=4460 RepID=A0A843WNV3_COLES|nr:hypothetical protein [Colocasia esculenta]